MARSEFESEPDEAEGWTFIDRKSPRGGPALVFEDISERKAAMLAALYRDRGWPFETRDPDERGEVFNG